MCKKCVIFAVTAVFGFCGFVAAGLPEGVDGDYLYKAGQGPYEVKTEVYDWYDKGREREVPVRFYWPAGKDLSEGGKKFPVIVLSHGLGGTREGLSYLSRRWVSWGYVTVHIEHVESNDSVWRGKKDPKASLQQATKNGPEAINRTKDVTYVLDRIEAMDGEDKEYPFADLADLSRVGIAGHSFGSHTTMHVCGQLMVRGRREVSCRDPRVLAGVALSSPVPKNERVWEQAYSGVEIPVLHMTGTEDNSSVGSTTAEQRTIPFEYTLYSERYLINFDGGDHMVFSGRESKRARPKDPMFHELILQSSLAFLDAYIKGDAEAKEWLRGPCAELLKNAGDYQFREAVEKGE